jgi:hypothetical protein
MTPADETVEAPPVRHSNVCVATVVVALVLTAASVTMMLTSTPLAVAPTAVAISVLRVTSAKHPRRRALRLAEFVVVIVAVIAIVHTLFW